MNIHERIERNLVIHLIQRMRYNDMSTNMNYAMDGSGECGSFIQQSHQTYLDKIFRRQGIRLIAFDGDLEWEASMFIETRAHLFNDPFSTCPVCKKFTVVLPEDNPYTSKYGCGHEYDWMADFM